MLVKAIIIFLLGMILLGMIGNLLLPGLFGRKQVRRAQTCSQCGRPLVGKGPCDCTRRRSA